MNQHPPSGVPHPQTHSGLKVNQLFADHEVFDILDHIPCPLAFISADSVLKIIYVNHAFTRMFGYQLNDVQTVFDWTALVYPNAELRQQRLTS